VIDTTTARLAERNMTRARILSQISRIPASPQPPPMCEACAAGSCGRARCTRNDGCACPCSLFALPPIVCLCGSTRFVDEFNRQRQALTVDGQIVLSIEIVTTQNRADDPQHADPALKTRLDELHLRKIDLADYIYVLNPGGYIGPSTRHEIGYAEATGKPVRYLEPPDPAPHEWACRQCGDAWHGTPPDDLTCPTGCTPASDNRPPKEHRQS
jgi:hypothetical protein